MVVIGGRKGMGRGREWGGGVLLGDERMRDMGKLTLAMGGNCLWIS